MRPTIKLLHTADLHLGAKFIGLGGRGAEQRRRLREALQDLTALAVGERVDAVLMAGDTFDNLSPSPESVSAFRKSLRALSSAGIPLLIIAGTHDPLGDRSFWPSLERESGGQFTLLTPERHQWRRVDGLLTVCGASLLAADRPSRPLAGMKPPEGPGWRIGMAHASLDIGDTAAREAMISPAEIAAAGFDYLALGHWHGVRDCSRGGAAAWYSGPPEMISADENQGGNVLLVELAEGRPPAVAPKRVGKRAFVRLEVAAEDLETMLEKIRPSADPETVLELVCSGIVPPERRFASEELLTEVAPWFFHVRLKNRTTAELTTEELERFPETTVIGRYIRLMQAEIESAGDDRREDLKRALQLGLALLLGREVSLWS